MPLNSVGCERNWGYDGNGSGWAAPHQPYGGPEALQRFVNAAHGKNLAVIVDAVFNHVGPVGDSDALFGPYYAEGEGTQWGRAPDFVAHEPRERIIDCALGYFERFHVDALRLDAVWELLGRDTTEPTLVKEMRSRLSELERRSAPRRMRLIAESGQVTPALTRAVDQPGGCGLDGALAARRRR